MRRLVIDARLAGHSGIGIYLEQMLPRVTRELSHWRPLVLARIESQHAIATALAPDVAVCEWDVPPLSARNMVAPPPAVTDQDLLWVPHFNVPLRSSVPLAVTLHDLLPLSAPGLVGAGRAVALRWWLRAIRTRAQAVFCISAFTRNDAVRFGACTMEQATVTPLGVDPIWFNETTAEHDADSGPPTIIFVGLLKPHKNVAGLLRAFLQVSKAIPHRLVLVAKHTGVRNIDREAGGLIARLGDRVELVENLPQAELVARVRAAAFAVVPSLHEGFGLPALEAMAAGTPVLASRAGALPEVCGDDALYCDPLSESGIAEGLLRLAGDAALRRQLSAAGRTRAAGFSWDRCAEQTATELDRALRESSRAAS